MNSQHCVQPALRGSRTPRVLSEPVGAVDFDAGLDAIDLASIAGMSVLEWEQDVVRCGMARRADGQWAASEVGLLVARQNGKTAAIEIVELGWMITEPGVHILHTAHEFPTALESMNRLVELIRANPKLENEIANVRIGNGKESIVMKNGSEIRYRTRTKSGGRGFTVDRLVIDEAMIWSPASMAALRPLMTTAENPQIWLLGSAADADEHEYCGKWASMRAAALSEKAPTRLLWMEWSAPEPPAPTGDNMADAAARDAWRSNPEHWAMANPSMGWEITPGRVLVTEDFIEGELESFRGALEKWEIERLSCGNWPEDADAHVSLFEPDRWQAMTNLTPTLTGPICLGVERAPKGGRWAVAAAQRTTDGRKHIEVGFFSAAEMGEVVDFVAELVELWDPVAVVIDSRSPTSPIAPRLVEAGIDPHLASTPQMAAWSGGFLEDATSALLSHTDQPALTNGVHAVTQRTLSQGDFVWARTDDGAASPVIAATLALGGLIEFGSEPEKPRAMPSTGTTEPTTTYARSGGLDLLSAGF